MLQLEQVHKFTDLGNTMIWPRIKIKMYDIQWFIFLKKYLNNTTKNILNITKVQKLSVYINILDGHGPPDAVGTFTFFRL